MMLDVADQLMLKWGRLNSDDEVDVAGDMTRLTLDTIALCGFGYRFNSFYRDTPHPFVAAMVRTLEESQTRSRSLPIQSRLRFRASRRLAADQAYMDQVVDAVRTSHRDGLIAGAVVDDQPLDLVEARDHAREVPQRGWELLLFVEAGDLDDQLHAPGYCGGSLAANR